MATVNTSRAAYQRPNPQLRIGKPPKHIATDAERANINKAIVALNNAKNETNSEQAMLAQLSEAFRLVRNIVRSRTFD